ncbi:MAG: hypothetical protein SFW36_04840, partial [Leptolyngbyaceae cyanobacterium bins.59]|nr:hypothetical protein [Leptolyngbyaceae cyanobacterium bins.59]
MISKQQPLRPVAIWQPTPQRPFPWATLIFILLPSLGVGTIVAWANHVPMVEAGFARLSEFQRQAADWFPAPGDRPAWMLTLVLFCLMQIITRTPYAVRRGMQILVATLLMVLTLRYLLWRSLTTLSLNTPLEGAFSLTLYSLELLGLLSYGIQLFMTLRERDRRKDADFYGAAVLAG